MEGNGDRVLRVTELDDSLVRDYLIKLLNEGEDFVQEFYRSLVEKSRLFQELLAKERLPSLSEEEAELVLKRIFSTRRRSRRVIEETGIVRLREAVSDLLYADGGSGFLKSPPQSWEERVEGFVKKVRGVSPRFARDAASELLHFTFPDRFVLWTSWIWDPETETGAVVFLKEEPPTGGRGRRMFGETYEEFALIYEQIALKLSEFGVRAKGYLFVDLFLAMIYATYVDYMTLSTMHSAKGFFPPAGYMAKRLLGVHTPLKFS